MEVEAAQPRERTSRTRLYFWILFVGLIAAINYGARFSGGSSVSRTSTHDAVYSYSTFVGGTILYAVWLGIVLLICIDRFDLLALRRPRTGWLEALGLAGAAVVAIFAVEGLVALLPLPQSPGKEQGLTPTHWEPAHAGAFAANLVLFAVIAPVRRGADLPRRRTVAAPASSAACAVDPARRRRVRPRARARRGAARARPVRHRARRGCATGRTASSRA